MILSTPIFRQTSICWKRREDLPAPLASATSTLSLASVATRGSGGGGGGTPRGSLGGGGGGAHNECLCVEIFGSNCLGFHNTPNTLLHEIVTKLQELEVVESVSSGIASVISDYTANMPPVLDTGSTLRKVVRLVGTYNITLPRSFVDTFTCCVQVGRPWHEAESSERITIGVIAVLAGSGYKLSMPINIDQDTRVYFFIKDPEELSDCYKVRILSYGIFYSLNSETQNVHQKTIYLHTSSEESSRAIK